jgi:prepilin-type processing-associated H-X9-DG protein
MQTDDVCMKQVRKENMNPMNPANQPRGPSGKRTTNAFTLLELLVIISITALLAAILMPSFAKAKFSSQVTACASNFKQWGYACAAYATENQNGYYPSFTVTGYPGENVTDVANSFLTNMAPYGMTAPMYFCPARPTGFNNDDSQWFDHSGHHIKTYIDLTMFYIWRSSGYYGFIILDNINFWVPRLDSRMTPPNYYPWAAGLSNTNDPYDPITCYNPIDITNGGWPLRTSDPAASKQPVITDYCLCNGNNTNVADIDVGTGHWFNNQFTGVNAGFADGHVEMHPPALVRWHMKGNGGFQTWMY